MAEPVTSKRSIHLYLFRFAIAGNTFPDRIGAVCHTCASFAATAVGNLLLGPAPFCTFLRLVLWLTFVALALLGFSLTPVIVSAMRCIVQGARDRGFKDDNGTFGLVGGIVQSSNCLGTFLGPFVGGVLNEHFGFGWTMVVSAVLVILPIIIFSPFLFLTAPKRCTKNFYTHTENYIELKEVKNGYVRPYQHGLSWKVQRKSDGL